MKINKKVIQMVRGDSELLNVTVKNYELSDSDSVVLSVRNVGRASMSVSLTAGNTLYFTKTATISDGVATIEIDPGDTKDMSPGRYVYDIELTTASGDVHTIVPINYLVIIDEVSV